MFGRELVDVSGRRRVRHVEARLRVRVRAPDVVERPSAAASHPDARILRAPASAPPPGLGRPRRTASRYRGREERPANRGSGCRRGASPRPPSTARRRRADCRAGEDAEPAHDVRAALRGLEQRLRRAHALEALRPIGKIELRRVGCSAIRHRIGLQPDRVADDVEAGREVQDAVSVDGCLERARVVVLSVALHAERMHVDPLLGRRQRADRGGERCGQCGQRQGVVARVDIARGVGSAHEETMMKLLTVYAAPGPRGSLRSLCSRAKTGTFEQIASATPICVVGFRSLLMTSAASRRPRSARPSARADPSSRDRC